MYKLNESYHISSQKVRKVPIHPIVYELTHHVGGTELLHRQIIHCGTPSLWALGVKPRGTTSIQWLVQSNRLVTLILQSGLLADGTLSS